MFREVPGVKWSEPELKNQTRYGVDEDLEAAADAILNGEDVKEGGAKLGGQSTTDTKTKDDNAKVGGKVLTATDISDPAILEHDFVLPDGRRFRGTTEDFRQAMEDYNENIRDSVGL